MSRYEEGHCLACCDPKLIPYLGLADEQLRPFLPLGALVPVIERGFIGGPAALLVAVPEGRQTDALLQVCHPIHS